MPGASGVAAFKRRLTELSSVLDHTFYDTTQSLAVR